jgi:cbb3-type cytochrome oxidase subunit 3
MNPYEAPQSSLEPVERQSSLSVLDGMRVQSALMNIFVMFSALFLAVVALVVLDKLGVSKLGLAFVAYLMFKYRPTKK